MQEIEKCLTENIEHLFDFTQAESGQMLFVCRLCGGFIQEFEDSQP